MNGFFRLIRRFALILMVIVGLTAWGVWASNCWVQKESSSFIFHSSKELPHARVGLLLGTSRYSRSGNPNLFFRYRIEAAVDLFKARKVDYLVVSGDNRTLSYNEPRDMRKALMSRGIPDSAIYMDFAGLRTFDSVVRCKEVFGQESFIIISQSFHLERALFIAQREGITAIGYSARDAESMGNWTTGIREVLAKAKAVLDVYVLRTRPRHLGDPVIIGDTKDKRQC